MVVRASFLFRLRSARPIFLKAAARAVIRSRDLGLLRAVFDVIESIVYSIPSVGLLVIAAQGSPTIRCLRQLLSRYTLDIWN